MKLNKEFLKNTHFNASDYSYSQNELSAGIVHIGVGNFHRSHQGYYLDALFNKRKSLDFGIVGAGLRSTDEAMRSDLKSQDFLTTVISRDENNTNIRVLQSMIDFVEINNLALIDTLLKEEIKIVSLTITEAGYYIDSNSQFNIEHKDIQEDINNFKNPKTVFGVLLLAIKQREEKKLPSFTLMSCDNISHNGDILKNIMCKMAEKIDKSLLEYIQNNVAFPNSMVDRITPVLSKKDQSFILDHYGYEDKRPVFCEPFMQWVLEDKFSNLRPKLEEVGVIFVKDILPYELMKLRLLNGSHSCLSSIASLLNITYVHEALQNACVRRFLDNIMLKEVIPSLKIDIDVKLEDYYTSVIQRFSNPYIEDTITRICIDNSSKYPTFVIESIKDAIKNGVNYDGLAMVCALWCRYCIGYDEDNIKLDINDSKKDELKEKALAAQTNPKVFLSIKDVFGDLEKNEEFVNVFTLALNSIYRIGVQNTVAKYNN